MIRSIAFTSCIIAGLIIGCSWVPGDDNPPQLHNTHWPNNGSYGPDALPYDAEVIEAEASVEIEAGTDAKVELEASADANCITQCAPFQCGTIANQCNGYITCTPCRDDEECVNNFCRKLCIPESDITFCNRLNFKCGTTTNLDNCGVQRTVNCGVAETDAELCIGHEAECVKRNVIDRCGTPREVTCVTCEPTQSCIENRCEEVPPLLEE